MAVSRVDGSDTGLPQIHSEAIKQATLAVCSMSEDVTDARILLDMLGLVPDAERFPPVPVSYRGVRDAPAQGSAAPLPVARYGGVPA